MKLLLIALAALLCLSHSIFFLRAFISRNKKFRPVKIDYIAKHVSHITLPIAVIYGSFVLKPTLIALLWAPILLIVVSQFLKKYVKRFPYILPVVNLIIFYTILVISCL